MSYEGHCICGNIRVVLPQQPASSLRCHCRNCSRSGGGSSINYAVNDADVVIYDPQSCLKTFVDTQTTSGNHIERRFCSNCGSPVFTLTPSFPGKKLIKASLFDSISLPNMEVYIHRRQAWEHPVAGAQQIGQ
ncbi:Mss4-like protein [Aspergillus floccosus]